MNCRRRSGVLGVLGGIAIAFGLGLTGCATAGYDAVLARQIFAVKDPLMSGIANAHGIERVVFVEDVITEGGGIPGSYWNSESDPADLALHEGGTVLYNLRDSGNAIAFDVLLASGPRDATADRFVSANDPYFGPAPIYTCFTIKAEFIDDRLADWSRRDGFGMPGACDATLVQALGPDATVEPVTEFDG
jgi:hypothetical protein